jgi:hypothetical protein
MYINVRGTEGQSRMDNPERNWQHWVHKTQDEDKQNKKHNTICVGQYYIQTNTNNV